MDAPIRATPGLPYTDKQLGKLWGEAKTRGWHSDEVHGRAAEINPEVAGLSLAALDRYEMSLLIEAVMTEPIWVDPNQLRLELPDV